MTQPVNLNIVKWLKLCDAADMAAMRPDPHAEVLAAEAGRLTTVTTPRTTMADTALITSFRWDCTAYGLAGALTRTLLAPGLLTKSHLVRTLLSPDQPPARVALPVPEAPPSAEVEEPSWMRRADIGG